MKVIMKPIEMVAWFDLQGVAKPSRFRIDGEVIKVAKVLHVTDDKWAGNKMKVYRCQSQVNGQLRTYELKYELNTCKWFLYKM